MHFFTCLQGFPYGTKPGEEERVSLPNASYTKGNYNVCYSEIFQIKIITISICNMVQTVTTKIIRFVTDLA